MFDQGDNLMKEENEQDQGIEQPLPLYAEVQGEKIFMGGLDYSLLKKQKQQDKKKGLLTSIQSQLSSISSKHSISQPTKATPTQRTDPQSTKLITALKQHLNCKPAINPSTYYLFDTRYEFGRLKPEIITKRFGRMNKQAQYLKVDPGKIEVFRQILERPKIDLNKMKKDKAINKLIGNGLDEDSQSDDIFGNDDNSASQAQKEEKQSKPLFNFGKKLDLGVKDSDIFDTKPKLSLQPQAQLLKPQHQAPPVQDKYQFLRKKVKKAGQQPQFDDGYGQCYIQSGPTFEQMKQYRNQGIQLWGDLKQGPKKPQRKVNINKEYNMVKKIIDEKSKGGK